MKECDIFRGGGSKHTLTAPTYFQGSPGQDPPNPQDLRPWSFERCADIRLRN